jgi:arylsulfatase A-like enzyme
MKNRQELNRRGFLGSMAAGAVLATADKTAQSQSAQRKQPNVVFVFGDQWRAQATGYAGDPNAKTPHLDKLATESLNLTYAVSGCPVCTPYRASLLTGQYWLTHGLFMNDVYLPSKAVSVAEAYKAGGYDTAYIGKWHVDGHGRSNYIPPDRRQGFEYWKVLECTHDYNNSAYYAGDSGEKKFWDGYDAMAQTRDAQQYIRDHARGEKPFTLFLSWGPPHAPYHTAPEKYRNMFDPAKLELRENVPAEEEAKARKELAGYYAHIAALDDCIGDLLGTLDDCGIADDTIFVFTSDHGDMLHCQGETKKQRPWDESIRVPFLLRYPAVFGKKGREVNTLLNSPDIMPTLLGLSGVSVPATCEGEDFAPVLLAGKTPDREGALICSIAPFGQWLRSQGGCEYRGVRTHRYTWVRKLDGPWLLYDNEKDPYQSKNLVDDPEYADTRKELDGLLSRLLQERDDEFLAAEKYIARYGIQVDQTGTVPYAG